MDTLGYISGYPIILLLTVQAPMLDSRPQGFCIGPANFDCYYHYYHYYHYNNNYYSYYYSYYSYYYYYYYHEKKTGCLGSPEQRPPDLNTEELS